MRELGDYVKAGNKEGNKNDAQLDAMRYAGSYPRIEKKNISGKTGEIWIKAGV